MNLTIKDVRCILTAPDDIDLVVVKIETSEPGLYGLGCATFTQRCLPVKEAVENYLRPLLIGRDPMRIEDIWQRLTVNSYWRNGPVLNNAISGVDMALWDIKGKVANLPVYQLLGGKCREAAAVYRHADGKTKEEVVENMKSFMAQGYSHIRCQLGGYGGHAGKMNKPENALEGFYYDPDGYMRANLELFAYIRETLGYEVNIMHDVHERLVPIKAVQFAKDVEAYKLFFLEDVLAPEDEEWLKIIRNQCATPIAIGELFNNPHEWRNLITNRLLDFIRVHVSQIGGLTPAKKLVTLCETFGVRTAWHGPGDLTPIGMAANLHLDISSVNFGIQEFPGYSERMYEVFPGAPTIKNGYMYPNDKPGLGVDFDEEKAKLYPCKNEVPTWTEARLPDGTIARP